jgi:hypothetical protein
MAIFFFEKMTICLLGLVILFVSPVDKLFAAASDTGAKRKPLRVIVRPRVRRPKPPQTDEDSETQRLFKQHDLNFKWKNKLNDRFLSGYEDSETLKKYGYSVNKDIGAALRMKIRKTDDPDNLLHLKDYRDKQIYHGVASVVINPMKEIKQGCKSKDPSKCAYSYYGQFWLRYNMRQIDIDRDRADNSLVNLIKSLD